MFDCFNIDAVDRLDALLSAEDAWRSHFSGTDADEVDDMKTPQCAESFITMLLTITDRYYSRLCLR